jgi:hypothetical protein
MKKIFSTIGILSILFTAVVLTSSYTGRPLFGTNPNQDNTGRQLTYGYTAIGDTAGSTIDTITIVPDNYEKFYSLTLVDSAVVAIKTTRSSFTDSKLTFIINAGAATGTKIKFLGYSGLTSQWLPTTSGTSTFSVTPSRTATISWICTGTKYAETGRSQN